MPAWNIERDGTYIFDFSPSRDDFSQVKVGAGWSLDPTHAMPGNEFACCFVDGSSAVGGLDLTGDDAWLFSAPFEFKAGVKYEAGLKYRAVAAVGGGDPPRLTLRLGSAQDPVAQTQRLLEFSISNTGLDTVRTVFEVPADGVYHFSLEGQPGAGKIVLSRNIAGIAGGLPSF